MMLFFLIATLDGCLFTQNFQKSKYSFFFILDKMLSFHVIRNQSIDISCKKCNFKGIKWNKINWKKITWAHTTLISSAKNAENRRRKNIQSRGLTTIISYDYSH